MLNSSKRTRLFVFLLCCAWGMRSVPAFAACSGASPNDWADDTAALQACLNAGGTVVLDPGSPGYVVNGLNGDVTKGLVLGVSGTTLTSSQAPTRATIIAGRNLFAHVLRTTPGVGVSTFTINYITFNGMVDDVWVDGPYRFRRDDCTDPEDEFRQPGVEYNPGNLMLQAYIPHISQAISTVFIS